MFLTLWPPTPYLGTNLAVSQRWPWVMGWVHPWVGLSRICRKCSIYTHQNSIHRSGISNSSDKNYTLIRMNRFNFEHVGNCKCADHVVSLFRPRRSRSAAAYSHQTFPWTFCRSVCLSVGRSVCLSSALWKTADRIRQPFGTIDRTGPGMRQVLGFANRSMERGTFGGEFGPHHCNQWGLYGVRVRQCLNRRRCGLGLSLIHISEPTRPY